MTDAEKIAAEVIRHFEGCRLKSYVLSGESWATVGWGCAIPLSRHPMTITQEQADELFLQALSKKSAALRKEIPAAVLNQLTANQLAAIISFRYNLKDSSWLSPSCRTRLALVNGKLDEFKWMHGKWINGEAGPLPGLKRRRKVERILLDNGSLESIKAVNWFASEKFY